MSQNTPVTNQSSQVTYSIAVDPGFNAFKVVVNGMYFNIPRAVIATDDSSGTFEKYLQLNREDFICCETGNRKYLAGAYAYQQSQSLNEENKSAATNDKSISANYFKTDDFKIGMEAAIGYAIYRYNKEVVGIPNNDKHLSFNVGDNIDLLIALPHAHVMDAGESVSLSQAKYHSFSLTVGSDLTQVDISYTIKPEKVNIISQTVAAVLCKILSSNSTLDINSFLPTVVIDGGYFTTGLMSLDDLLNSNPAKDESNTTYTANSINQRVAADLKKVTGRTDIDSFTIDKLLLVEPEIRYRDLESNTSKTYNVKQRKDEITKEIQQEFIEYLDKKYNYLVAYKSVHIAGGTGLLFSEVLKDYYVTKTNTFTPDQIVMVEGSAYNKATDTYLSDRNDKTISVGFILENNYSATYGVAIGAYRVLTSQS